MKLFDAFSRGGGARGFHTTIVTTFGIDFGAFEYVLMPQFEGAGATNVILIGDERMLALGANGASMRPLRAGAHYLLHPVRVPRGGVFHSKFVLQLGRQGARLVLGSANATGPGLGGNRELVVELDCEDKDSPERTLICQAWTYLNGLVEIGASPERTREAFDWARRRTPWLAKLDEAGALPLSDGTEAAFLPELGIGAPSLMARYLAYIGAGPVDRLIVISPYWDDTLGALHELQDALTPSRTQLLIQRREALFPVEALGKLDVDIHDIDTHDADKKQSQTRRFVHAKLIVVSKGEYDHVLIGSANCTRAALGGRILPASNGETCLYRRLPRGVIFEELELVTALAGTPLASDELKPQKRDEDIPLKEADAALPGAFEFEAGLIRWRPKAAFAHGAVELLDKNGAVVMRIEGDQWIARADGSLERTTDIDADLIRFARASVEGRHSLDAVIVHPSALADRRKERSSRKASQAAALLDEVEDFDLTLLEAMAELEKEDDTDENVGPRRPRARSDAPEEENRKLSYEDFLRGRQTLPANSDQRARNTLAGQNVDSVRATLNRILFDEGEIPGLDPFDLGDDLGDDPNDEHGGGAGPKTGGANKNGKSGKIARAPSTEPKLRPFDPKIYAGAVHDFGAKLKARAGAGDVRSREALRLRLLIMILVGKAAAPLDASPMRRLHCDDSPSGWPRLVFNLCAQFFYHKPTAITVMAMDERYHTLPDDLLEAWLTAFWSLALAQHCLKRAQPKSALLGFFTPLLQDVRAKTGLRTEDLSRPHAQKLLARLAQIYQPRLAVGLLTLPISSEAN